MTRALSLAATLIVLATGLWAEPYATPGRSVVSEASGFTLSGDAADAMAEFKQSGHYGAFYVNTKRGSFGWVHGVHSLSGAQEMAELNCRKFSLGAGRHCALYATLTPAAGQGPAGAVTLSKSSSEAYQDFKALKMEAGTFAAFAINGLDIDGYVWNRASAREAQRDAVSVCQKFAKDHQKVGFPIDLKKAQSGKKWGCKVVAERSR